MKKLNSIKKDKIWGYELWIASTHINGCQEEFKKIVGGDYPLLVKVIQANDSLSIQVHPDDEWAVKLEGENNRGKTECWYILDAQQNSKIVYGIKEGFSNEILSQAIKENKLENYLNICPVKKNDFIFIPSGTVHAIGSGLRIMEIQQTCDITYRLYDWGRGRDLHIEKGLSVIKRDGMLPIKTFSGFFECKYFNLHEIITNEDCNNIQTIKNDSKNIILLYIISAENAWIYEQDHKKEQKISSEEIYAINPGLIITIEGSSKVMKIVPK